MLFQCFINKLKYRHYKEVILVDSENVGYGLTHNIPKTTLVYVFVSDLYATDKIIEYKNDKNIKFIDITSIRSGCYTKNILDFCLMVKLTEIVHDFSNKIKIIICSKDKGYDAGIQFIKEHHPYADIVRYPGSLKWYYSRCHPDFIRILNDVNPDILTLISNNTQMKTLKTLLPKSKRKMFVINEYTNKIGMVSAYIELDIYTMEYCLYYSGNCILKTCDKQEVLDAYSICVNKIHRLYDKYQTHERFKKSNELQIRPYIEEAYLNNQSLQQCLIDHLGDTIGRKKYLQYIQI